MIKSFKYNILYGDRHGTGIALLPFMLLRKTTAVVGPLSVMSLITLGILSQSTLGASPKQAQVISCGAIITSDTVMANDLDCPTTTGFAVQVIGDRINFNGNGHTITAPLAGAGLYVHGNSNSVVGLQVRSANYGVFAYDSPDVFISACNLTQNQIGIELYAENTQMTGAQVFGNILSNNAIFGIHTGQAAPGAMISPLILANDLSHSGQYAMSITAAEFEYSGTNLNSMKGSTNGIYLAQGHFYIHDLNLSREMIPGTQIFVDAASDFRICNCDVSSLTPALPSEQRTGIDLYEVENFVVKNVTAKKNDMGVRLETQSGQSCNGQIFGSHFSHNDVAGVSIISYDGTSYGKIEVTGNTFNEVNSSLNIVLHAGTVLGSGSTLQ